MEYIYHAKTKDGQMTEGTITAENEAAVLDELHKMSLFIVNVKPVDPKGMSFFKKKVSLKDKIIFTKQLSIMIKGGLPLVEAIEVLQQQSENLTFKEAISKIRVDVRGGMALSKALTKHEKIFPNFYIAVVASGEKSGKLDKVLESLAVQLQKDYDLISKVKSAITYPIVIVCALVGVMVLMLVFVVPQLKSIFDQMGVVLPLPTRLLLAVSYILTHYWYIVIVVIAGLYFAFKSWGRSSAGGLMVDTLKIRMPIFGPLVKKIYLARFARTTATLISSGVSMLDVLSTDKEVISNHYFDPIFNTIGKDIENGAALSKAIKKHKIFPLMIAQMISVGERSGKIDDILFELADFYDKEVEATTANMASLIEPILIILIGGGIGMAIASVILPIYSLVNVI